MTIDLAAANDALPPLARHLGVRLTEAGPDRIVAELTIRPEHCTVGNICHGGTLMALADTAGAVAAFLNLPQGAAGTTTIESKTNLVASAPVGATLVAAATPVHRGRRAQTWQTRIEAPSGRLVSLTIQTQLTL